MVTKITFLWSFLLLTLKLEAQQTALPPTEVSFQRIQLLDKYVSEGASIADIDMDGYVDIVAGPLCWKGPRFTQAFAYGPVKYFPITGPGLEGYATNFFTFPGHFDGDKFTDILQVGIPGTDGYWVKNPGQRTYTVFDSVPAPEYWPAVKNVGHESPMLADILGDSAEELLAFSRGRIVIGIPMADEDEAWDVLAISPQDAERFPVFSHGLGVGDIDGDGLVDILEKSGWWEQPKNWDRVVPWKYHPYPFSMGRGGAQMIAYDVDGDGDTDVVTALDAHGFGLSWHEQVDTDSIGFVEHQIMTDRPQDNPYGLAFSQLHALTKADIDNDGIPDIVTGKCYYAHNGRDPGAEEPAVLYWFRTKREQDGTVTFIPYLIDGDSGVGRQISAADINGDGKVDVVVANKKGVFAFVQK